jgi:kynurenine formamidase
MVAKTPDMAQVDRLMAEISNWDKWGRDDQLGTLNYISRQKVVEASRLVRTGRVVSISHDLITSSPAAPDERPAGLHPSVRPARLSVFRNPRGDSFGDELSVFTHGYVRTHIDALSHVGCDGRIWNGRSVDEAVTKDGVQFCDVLAMGEGVVTRGVLLDVARVRGVDSLDGEDTVSPADLVAAEELAGTTVTPGDAVLVRVGAGLRIVKQWEIDNRVGLAPECAEWLHEKQVALFGSDCPEKVPSGYEPKYRIPFHQVVMVKMGLALLDNVAMEPLAVACAEEGRNDFMFTMAPLRVPRATGSVVNPLVLF